MKNNLNWFEIPAEDIKRAKTFYEAVLGLKMLDMDIQGDLKMSVFPHEEVGGAICQYPEFYFPGNQGPLIYLNVNPDLQIALDRVEAAGGKIQIPKKQISEDHGYMAVITDTEGNRIALHSNL